MRTLLIGLSLAATAMASPALATECHYLPLTDTSESESFNANEDERIVDISTERRAPPAVFQYAVIHYYLVPLEPEQPLFRAFDGRSDHPELDPRFIPATHHRIKTFKDEMYQRYGELSAINWT